MLNLLNCLIELLLDIKELKERFFVKAKETLVFNQSLFIQFLEQKNHLNDSYTQYKKKVGLTIDGKYLKQKNEVALVWPFKDCILEGGQNKEEQKRDEIFFNEVLAQDEITQLLDRKVLTNAKVFDKDGKHEFEGFTRDAEINKKRGLPEDTITDNLIIKGNNLLALHSLEKEFAGKVKLIYIDPPYYFRENKQEDAFKYNSNFKLSTWLTFMKNRLMVAKKLLHKDGVIFVQIDDDGQAHLKILLEEIFGINNFIANFVWTRKKKGSFLSDKVRKMSEFIIAFSFKPANETKLFGEKAYSDKWQPIVKRTNSKKKLQIQKNIISTKLNDGNYEKGFKGNKDTGIEFLTNFEIKDGVIVTNIEFEAKSVWSQEFLDEELKLGTQISLSTKFGFNVLRYNQESKFKAPSTLINKDNGVGTNEDATKELADMFGTEIGEIFSYSKPTTLMKYLISMISYFDKNAIIFDYHAGSGTTAHAVLELNKKDGGNRQFILVEQMEYIETVTNKRVQKVIEQNIHGSFTYLELKKYNQVFIEQIEEAKDSKRLLQIWEQMKSKSFLNYNVDIQKQDEHIEEFKKLELTQQKEHLIELLDKNQLYVNLSSINDKDFRISKEDKQLTNDFYQIKKD